ncbi:hypothetical protein QH494_02595 [Sphingomonas sp. AR_OL41]|uniref:hypothetical protein n=1 Tax=Sphingomonas sp. AR_OL41 TaxID=3042729 RepID=UPI00248055F1|nr:hypothetical protein [Sphingomonas sp. AR_OL41]MDH7971058.1 hypothetical protein [Sphingomonas sp. AR_OL41]
MPVKLILILVGSLGLIVGAKLYLNHVKQTGVMEERQRTTDLIAREDKANRDFETKLQSQIDAWGKRYAAQEGVRVGRETVYRDRIIKDAATIPDCHVPAPILEDRNAIRADEALPQ